MMMKSTVRAEIIVYLQTHPGWVSGMEIESKAYEWKSKRIGRTLRDMSSGPVPVLEKSYDELHHAVRYRLRQDWSLRELKQDSQVTLV